MDEVFGFPENKTLMYPTLISSISTMNKCLQTFAIR